MQKSAGTLAHSARELAQLSPAGYPASERQVSRLLAREDCPFGGSKRTWPIELGAYIAWYDATIAPNKPGADRRRLEAAGDERSAGADQGTALSKQRIEIQLKAEQALLYRRRREILEGRYVRHEEHERALVALVTLVRDHLEEWIDALPAQMDDLDAAGRANLRRRLAESYDRLCEDLQGATVAPIAAERAGERKTRKTPNPAKSKAARRRWSRNE